MLHLAVVAVEDDGLARVVARLAANLCEERREAVVVVERPAVERVIVALRALDAHAHEDLRRILGELQRVRLDLVIGRGRVVESAARSRQQALHDVVQRRVGQHLVPQPLEVEQRALRIDHVVARADFEQLGPFHHPQVGEFLAAEQPVHQPVALGGVRSADEGAGLLRRRQCAGEVQVGAADECGVVADRGRHQAQLLELGEDRLVNVVARRDVRPRVRQVFGDDDDLRPDVELAEPGLDERLAALAGGDGPVVAGPGSPLVVAEEHRERRHVPLGRRRSSGRER